MGLSGLGVPTNQVYQLLASTNLQAWSSIAQLHHQPFKFLDPSSDKLQNRFYRLLAKPFTPTNDWKNQILASEDPFLSPITGSEPEPRWIKFAILTNEPGRVYYQPSQSYLFHYDFAKARLPGFQNLTRAEFDQVSLRAQGQKILLGAVLFPPPPQANEIGIQFVGMDSYPPEQLLEWLQWVRATLISTGSVLSYYMPTFEQWGSAQTNQNFFAAHGFPVSTSERWTPGNAIYAAGWSLGRLKFIPAAEIAAAYADGRLQPTDILMTDGVPAELPYLAGIISFAPSTPNSHVAILAKSHAIPFVFIAGAEDQTALRQLDGREALVRAQQSFGGSEVIIADMEGQLSPALKADLLAVKRPGPIGFTPKETYPEYAASTETLNPADIRFFGGKAANFGMLRRKLPTNSPDAIAFSFKLWDEFLALPAPAGGTLSEAIRARLAAYTNYPPNFASLRTNLTAIQTMIRDASFTESQKQAILAALPTNRFDPLRKIRFRSSTNLEDSETFTGAGLYDSYSGCLMDDLDLDSAGPSHCDAEEDRERGVFRAIQRVYASFYNENAFLERLRHGVDESKVGMGVLVHHSYPDPQELANGVATLIVDGGFIQGELVTQKGAVSVTNPDSTAKPEVVEASIFSFGSFLDVTQRSSLVPLGGSVLNWESEYRTFISFFTNVVAEFQRLHPKKTRFALDFEYKKIEPSHLEVKQVREIPLPDQTGSITPFLLNEPGTYTVFQGEYGNVMGNHRLKSKWQMSTKNIVLIPENLKTSLYEAVQWEFMENGAPRTLPGPIGSWPEASFEFQDGNLLDRWTLGAGADRKPHVLRTSGLETAPGSADQSIWLLRDLRLELEVTYPSPMPVVSYFGEPETTLTDSVVLVKQPQRSSEDLLQTREHQAGSLKIFTSFYWPPPPKGVAAGYTAPLVAFVETRIEGLTSAPLVLHGFYSQTYRPEHHNFGEHFIFEPGLDPDVRQAARDELTGKNIRLLHVYWGGEVPVVQALGLDGKWRPL